MQRYKSWYIPLFLGIVLYTFSTNCSKEFKISNVQKAEEITNSYVDSLRFSGSILVAKSDTVLFSIDSGFQDYKNAIPNHSDTKFRLASLSKQFTAAALLILEQNGVVDFDTPINNYLNSVESELFKKITIHHLLSHSSGLGRDIESISFDELSQSFVALDSLINLIAVSELIFEPGESWAYSNLGYTVAAAVIEEVSEKDYGTVLNEIIFSPLGMINSGHEDSRFDITDSANGHVSFPNGVRGARYEDKSYVIGGGSIYSTSSDLHIWGQEIINGSLFSEKSKERLFEYQAGRYSYGWFVGEYVWYPVTDSNTGANIHHSGGSPGFESKMSILKEHELLIIILSNKLPAYANEISNKITNTLLGFSDEQLAKPDNYEQFFDVLFDNGVQEAIKFVEQTKDLNRFRTPTANDIYLIGRGYIDAKEYDRAMLTMDYLIETTPEWTFPYLFKATIFEETQRPEEAIIFYEKVLEINPNQSNAINSLIKLKQHDR